MKDLSGQRFGRLVVLSRDVNNNQFGLWICICDCGTEKSIRGARLITGETQSCGCLLQYLAAFRVTGHGQARKGLFTPEYKAWAAMLGRCNNPKDKDYHRYGARGIRASQPWHTFDHFFADMGKKPSPRHSLDRWPNNNGNYERGNCRWATSKQQNRNTRRNRFVDIDGERITIAEASERYGIKPTIVNSRLNRGWSVCDALTRPVRYKLPTAETAAGSKTAASTKE